MENKWREEGEQAGRDKERRAEDRCRQKNLPSSTTDIIQPPLSPPPFLFLSSSLSPLLSLLDIAFSCLSFLLPLFSFSLSILWVCVLFFFLTYVFLSFLLLPCPPPPPSSSTEPSVNPSNAGVVAGAVIGSLLALLLVAALIAVLVTRSRRQQQGYRANSGGDMKSRIFGGGKKASKNGTGAGAGSGGIGNNNGPIYVYNDGSAHQGLGEKNNHHHQPLTIGGRPEVAATTPTAQDILLSAELDEAERRKFDELEEEEERYDHFAGGAPILQLRPPHDQDDIIGGYLDDDMESQRDGSVISRTAVYV
ncbi:uncharacterized protein si:ch73-22o12.1 [Lampris incognitus]|uniref:uncharacterized protein si:ch73-22o12.1 n=1 Tax=Lampris incognitus TaxID=2546036 RepID=UPI0024B59F0D|nr:uncharacterized protein si:ch73-22o12.1 [Lampris incognitus]